MSDDPASREAFQWEVVQNLILKLRIPWDGMGDIANAQRLEAANMLNKLTQEIDAWRATVCNNDRDISDLIQHRLELISDADNLRAERDEARRDLCYADEGWPFPDDVAREKANERGWDCFKDKT